MTDPEHWATVEGVLPQCPSVRHVILAGEWPSAPAATRLPDVGPDDQAWVGYTSGTTGLPKDGAPIHDGWGSTETSSFATMTPIAATRVPGSCGLPLPGCAVRVVDPEGRDVALGERGEMLVRGPNVTWGYLNKPDQAAAGTGTVNLPAAPRDHKR